jgi:hypothetical protein
MKIVGKSSLISNCIKNTINDAILIETKSLFDFEFQNHFKDGDTIVYLSSILRNIRLEEQTSEQWQESFFINTILPIRILKYLNENFINFTFCYLGSESAYKGSFDDTYFLSKNSTQTFIEKFKLKSENSRIFSIAPSTVLSGMTLRRTDTVRLEKYKQLLRNKRFLSVQEISDIIITLCSTKFAYLSNETVNLNFGKFSIYE